jgi:hypothetical protein
MWHSESTPDQRRKAKREARRVHDLAQRLLRQAWQYVSIEVDPISPSAMVSSHSALARTFSAARRPCFHRASTERAASIPAAFCFANAPGPAVAKCATTASLRLGKQASQYLRDAFSSNTPHSSQARGNVIPRDDFLFSPFRLVASRPALLFAWV